MQSYLLYPVASLRDLNDLKNSKFYHFYVSRLSLIFRYSLVLDAGEPHHIAGAEIGQLYSRAGGSVHPSVTREQKPRVMGCGLEWAVLSQGLANSAIHVNFSRPPGDHWKH